MRGQFFIIAAFLLVVSLSIVLKKIKHYPTFDFKMEEVFFLSTLRYLPREIRYNFINLEVYNFRDEYEGPIVIPMSIYKKFNSRNSFTTVFEKPYFIVFSRIKIGENKFLEFNKEKEMRYFYRGDCIGTRNYSICTGYIDFPPGRIYFNFSIREWGDVFLEFDSGIFLPNSILFFSEKNLTTENLNYTDIGDGYKLYNDTLEVYLIGNVSYLGNDTFNVRRGVLFFGDVNRSRMAYYQDFYFHRIEMNFGRIEDPFPICSENEVECGFNKRHRETSGYYKFCCNETGIYNFITRFSGNTIGFGRECYSLRGVEDVSIFEPKRTGEYKKEKDIVRIFDYESPIFYCSRKGFEWYSNKYYRGLDGYIYLGNVSGNFSILINSTGDFWINFSSGNIYMKYPEYISVDSSRKYFYYEAVFHVNSTIKDLLIPIYSRINGTLEVIKEFYSNGDTVIRCDYCNVKIFDGPIKIYDEIISEKRYYLRKNYVMCDPECNVTSDEIYFYKGYLYCPVYPGWYLRARYLLNGSFFEIYNIKEDPFTIQGVEICINGNCSAIIYRGSAIYSGKISNCDFKIYGDFGYFYCPGKGRINFSEIPEFNGRIIFPDKFYMSGSFQKIDNFTYNFTDYFEVRFYNSGAFLIDISENETEVRRGGIVLK